MAKRSSYPSDADFEALFVNNAELDELRAHLAKFNPFDILGMGHMEIRHSYTLAWLLDPQGNHGMGEEFLRRFLMEALRDSEPAEC